MKKILAIQIASLILVSGVFGGLCVFTDIYQDVQKTIVKTLCLSCLKLQPKLVMDFTYKTANEGPHPDFILDALEKGPVFLHYSENACAACDIMFPVIQEFFDINLQKEVTEKKIITYGENTISYFYIYLDDPNTPQEYIDAYDVYDKEHVEGVPMFTVITTEYEHGGNILPYYATLYGAFNNNDQERMSTLTILMEEANGIYNRNH